MPATEPAAVAALRGNYDESTDRLREHAQRLVESASTSIERGWAELALAEFENELENDAACLARIEAALALAQTSGADDLAFAALALRNVVHVNRGRPAEAELALAGMQNLADARPRHDWLAEIAHDRGVLERKRGNFDLALKHFLHATELQRRLPGSPRLAHELNSIGMLYGRTGRFADAAAVHNQALHLARERGDRPEIARSLRLLGVLYRNLDDEEQGSRYLSEALEFVQQRNRREQIAIDGELTQSLVLMNRLDQAGFHAVRNAALAAATGNPPNKVSAFTRMAEYQLARGDLNAAMLWADRAYLEHDRVALRDQVLLELTRVRVRAARKASAATLAEARSALAAIRRIGDRILERSALDVVADLEWGLGDAQSAYATRTSLRRLDKELAMDLAGRRIAMLEANLERQRLDAERQLLERDGQIKDLRILRQRYLGIALVIGMLALFTVLAVAYSRMRAMRRMHGELQASRDQLAAVHAALVASNGKLQTIAESDALTGLSNRHAVVRHTEPLLQRARHSDCLLALLLFDLDHFKTINDRFGHQAGDAVLREIAARSRASLPAECVLGRWGGEEFIAIVEVANNAEAQGIAERLRANLGDTPVAWPEQPIETSASIGLAIYDRRQQPSLDEWINQADRALYQAKREGRNRVRFANDA
ncbi:MAG: diguanylate cyclase [Lysobacterales bacterium]